MQISVSLVVTLIHGFNAWLGHMVSALRGRWEAGPSAPLCDDVHDYVSLSPLLGGRSVMMLMHHSRNTEQKQWDETLVLVLAGLTKV